MGRSGPSNLLLNTGHGTLGWTMAAGWGRVLADMISDRVTETDAADLGMVRYAPKARRPSLRLQPKAA